MERKFIYSILILLILNINHCKEEVEEDPSEVSVIIGVKNSTYTLPDEIYEQYTEYETLEEFNNTCSYENYFESYTEKKLEESIKRENCIPNSKTFQHILDAGWINLTEYLVTEVYLPKNIDPTNIIYTYIKKYETQTDKLKYLNTDLSQYDAVTTAYTYENYENSVKIFINLPDASYVVEYLSIFCYKDSLKVNAIFKARHKFFRILESKTLFDSVEGECEYNYNSFNHKIEISFNKVNKLKKWTSLFKI